jgi:hypothetical protein
MKSPQNHWKYNEITDVETENGGEGGKQTLVSNSLNEF